MAKHCLNATMIDETLSRASPALPNTNRGN